MATDIGSDRFPAASGAPEPSPVLLIDSAAEIGVADHLRSSPNIMQPDPNRNAAVSLSAFG